MLNEYMRVFAFIQQGYNTEHRFDSKKTKNGLKFLVLLALRSPFSIAETVINAVFLQNAFDAAALNSADRLTRVCLAYGLANLCLFLYNGAVWNFYAPFAARMEGKLRVGLFKKIAAFSCQRVEASTQGEWLTRLNTDVEAPFSRAVHLPHLACAFVSILASSVILWLVNPAVFGLVILFVAPHIAVSQLLTARAMPELMKKSLEATAGNTDDFTAIITCADTTALYGAQDFIMKRYERSSFKLLRANMKIHTRKALNSGILPLFGLTGYLTLLTVSGGWIADGSFTFGDLTAAFQYRGGVLVGAIMLINCLISVRESMAGIKRMNTVFSEREDTRIG